MDLYLYFVWYTEYIMTLKSCFYSAILSLTIMDKHLLYDWIHPTAPDEVIEFAVSRLDYEHLNLIKDKKLRKRAIKTKKKIDCPDSFRQ